MLLAAVLPGAFAQTTPKPAITAITTAGDFGAYAGTAAPGSYIQIYGTNLAGSTRQWAPADFNGLNAPTTLDGVTVTVNGGNAFISYVSPAQINAPKANDKQNRRDMFVNYLLSTN